MSRLNLFLKGINVKLAQRIVCSLSLWERVGERETGIAGFIFRGGPFAMPVRMVCPETSGQAPRFCS